jgi:hypothetical protein
MAENEYLDSSHSQRWRLAVLALQTGCDQLEIAERLKQCLYKELRVIQKELPLAEMIRAIGKPQELSRLFATLERGELVGDLFNQAVAAGDGTEAVLKRFLDSALNNCLYDIPWMAAEGGSIIGISRGHHLLKQAAADLQPELNRIAVNLTVNPEWKLRRAAARHEPQAADETSRMLSQSLLGGGLR